MPIRHTAPTFLAILTVVYIGLVVKKYSKMCDNGFDKSTECHFKNTKWFPNRFTKKDQNTKEINLIQHLAERG